MNRRSLFKMLIAIPMAIVPIKKKYGFLDVGFGSTDDAKLIFWEFNKRQYLRDFDIYRHEHR